MFANAPRRWPPVVNPPAPRRTDWSLLSSDLQFIYLDPVLAHHLDTEADLLVGKSLLAFVHPEEQQTAKQDLGSVLESKTLHGSVTRVRFLRLSGVRRKLGYAGSPVSWSEADRIALDNDYMAVDIVINWAAEGLVLCFIHASMDLSPNDNDEVHKTEWSNWCETPMMANDQIDLLLSRLLVCIPQTGNMNRVFQILANQPDKHLLLSWPPGPSQSSEATSLDFAKLVETVSMDMGVPGASDAKTSCTRRYKALHNTPIFGGEVERCIIFACHKVNPCSRNTTNPTAAMNQLAFAAPAYNPQPVSSYYDQSSPYPVPPLSSQDNYAKAYMSQAGQGTQAPYPPPQRWSQAMPPPMNNMRSNSYISPTQDQSNAAWQQAPPPQPTYLDTVSSQAPSFNRPLSPSYTYSPTTPSSANTSPTSDIVPPPRRRISPTAGKEFSGPTRTASNRPAGILKCSSCKATSSPEWRKGPSGKKELCNACGLRYARSRAKKEGQGQGQRRRKDKPTILKRETGSSPVNATSPYATIRRNFADGVFPAAPPVSGNEIFSPSGGQVLEKLTPSPSPPSSNMPPPSGMNFVHYAPTSDNRSSYSNNYYPTPSPLSNPPYSAQTDASTMTSTASSNHNINQLPPLVQISNYTGRLSPLIPSPPLNSQQPSPGGIIPVPSSERSRERDRDYHDLPPTPLSAEPRSLKRSFRNSSR
ncbi:hypothetical protein CC1G_06391 [Coprinopsis cinerea okayama7|uniref:GATA-type domain-containing protein n=1 Tax=Coprinopsis cinerea (strain Okayama-7 / 130 / ATCC MYA-4618 / FGSC 9003) TaxID=240176 RepID=A8NTU6_COPC7|nr:hypothetical protein CC1G_06391 [Coprinopsis cinerea okayama7\|eukprot:XP_001836306.2 hypothetical protein CC1G_06391 [Coprinopsis cinerea okayama7\